MFALALLVPVAVVGGIVALVFFLVRGNRGEDAFTSRNMLRVYLRLAYMASLVVFLVGAVYTLTAGFAVAFGHDFSYYPNAIAANPCGPIPPSGGDPTAYKNCTSRYGSGGAPIFAGPPDTRQQDDLIRGLSLMFTGLILGAGHRLGQRASETLEERHNSGLARTEAALGTVGFGLVTIIALPIGAYSVMHHLILGNQVTSSGPDMPGQSLAVALVFTPAWLYYLYGFVTRGRSRPAVAATPTEVAP
ncbi:MAG: hypothetical protein ABR598_03345 [Candidatus Dormibacteria bacterium]